MANLDTILAQLSQPPQSRLDMPRYIELCHQALTLLNKEDQPELWADVKNKLGFSYAHNPQGSRINNLEQAISHYQQALEIYTRQAFLKQWAGIQNNLANAFVDRIAGDRGNNLEQGIFHYQQALEVYTPQDSPEDWAMIQNNLANAFVERIGEDRADNLEQAIFHYQQALKVYTRQAFPEEWAMTQNNLATTFSDRIIKDRADNLEQAIFHYQQALEAYTRQAFPEEWAMTQNNLANAFAQRIVGNRANNLEQAIFHYQQALEIYTRQDFPEDWAMAQHNFANAYRNRAAGDRANNLERAIFHYQQALEVYTRQEFPEDWAMIRSSLANAYVDRIVGDRADNLERAIFHYQGALEIYTPQTFPERWAATQNNLGSTFVERISGERVVNLEQAIFHHRQALEVYTLQTFPEQWAATQNNLAIAYHNRIMGDQADNLERAIYHHQQALKVRTRQDLPGDWAMTQHNLATTFLDRIAGDRAGNLEQAIYHYQEALGIYTPQAFPQDWAMTQNNLGLAFFYRIVGQRVDNLEQSVFHYRQALEVRTHQAFPQEFRQTNSNLGHLYFTEENWLAAVEAYTQAIAAGRNLLGSAYTEIGRQFEIAETSQLFARTAYAYLKLRQFDQVLLVLEEGKAQLLTEALHQTEQLISQLPDKYRLPIQKAQETIRGLEIEARLPTNHPGRRPQVNINEDLAQARTALRQAVETARAVSPELFPESLSLDDILAIPTPDSALVFLLFTSQDGAILVIPHGLTTVTQDNVIWLDEINEEDLNDLLIGTGEQPGWLRAYDSFINSQGRGLREWLTTIDTISQKLWKMVVQPLYAHLQALNIKTITILRQGGLQLLPLHASWCLENGQKHYLLDDYVVHYAPSCQALQPARQAQMNVDKCSLLAISNPTQDLPHTPTEVAAIVAMFAEDQTTTISETDATHDAVLENGRVSATIFHFSGHGTYSWFDPQESGLICADKKLTLHTIQRRMNLSQTRLVCLSACETGVVDVRQSPDEFIGLPAGFMAAGAPAVVSSLWPVSDLSTMLLMERFYANYLGGIDLPSALREAQLWLRDVSAEELAARFAKERHKSTDERVTSYEQASAAWRRFAGMRSDERPFAHPFYWAAFTLSGV